jgi:hypothetical protein
LRPKPVAFRCYLRRVRSGSWFLACSLLTLLPSAIAFADGVGLHWVRGVGAEQCIGPRALAERVEALTGPVFSAPSAAERSIEGLVSADKKRGFRVRLTLSQRDQRASSERVLVSQEVDCRSLDATLAFVIALTIDHRLAQAGLSPELLSQFAQEQAPEESLLAELRVASSQAAPGTAGPVSASESAPTPTRINKEPHAPPPAAPQEASGPRFLILAQATGLIGTLPSFMPGVSGELGVSLSKHWLFSALGRGFFGITSEPIATSNGNGEAELRAFDVGASLCPLARFASERLLLRGCLGVQATRLAASGGGFDRDRQARLWEATLALGFGLGLELGRGVGLQLDVSARARLGEQAFEYARGEAQRETVLTPGRFGGVLSLGPSYAF